MATFAPFAPEIGVSRDGPDLTVALLDPPRAPNEPIVRPGVARHAGAPLVWLPLDAQGAGTFPLAALVTGTCRRVTPPALPGVTTVLELSPLPFESGAVLRRLPGYPTFYLAPVTGDPLPADDELVRVGSTIVNANAAFVGMLFDDRVAPSPAA